jgi:hypothetical protein
MSFILLELVMYPRIHICIYITHTCNVQERERERERGRERGREAERERDKRVREQRCGLYTPFRNAHIKTNKACKYTYIRIYKIYIYTVRSYAVWNAAQEVAALASWAAI